ncbi:DUF1622 domain-containing protein [Cryobacterium sp. TMT2-23]|uniref:DUF1622 domain-containing protein n=1 Tax=Cryobacterium sp. TMT2-23 TaxID=1259252 RepID=UPI00106A5A31|nr:DUF1622 domain-containing protein [Cryobacterium sp. TMT2-23]TFD16686.1 DUF1622 domain-containing protein [Cryobacterium sp. TMT2-23]
MDFEQVIAVVIRVVEAAGAAIMVLGGAAAVIAAVLAVLRADTRPGAYTGLRRNLGRAILLGLEVLIIADIIRTILVDPTPQSVLVLGAIVVIRVLLSFSLEVEMDGVWPWSRWRLAAGKGTATATSAGTGTDAGGAAAHPLS